MLNDLDSITFLGGSAASNMWTTTNSSSHTTSTLNPSSYGSFSNSYMAMEDMTGSASVMVNPNNVMPIHPLHHQQVTSLSVNTSLNPNSPSQGSPGSPMNSPIYANHQPQQIQQVYQRPAKSVRVLPPVSSPMQQVQVKNIY